jgi:UDP-3-O-[3-hydroxymyristoyl] glucosamine N-acyltransferase
MISVSTLTSFLDNSFVVWSNGESSLQIKNGSTISSSGPGEFTFITNQVANSAYVISQCKASLLLLDNRIAISSLDFSSLAIHCIIAVPDARLAFIKVLNRFFPKHIVHGERNPLAMIAASAKLHSTANIAVGAVISAGCVIGENSCIGAYTVLHEGTIVGTNTVIESHCTIGSDGFVFSAMSLVNCINFPTTAT